MRSKSKIFQPPAVNGHSPREMGQARVLYIGARAEAAELSMHAACARQAEAVIATCEQLAKHDLRLPENSELILQQTLGHPLDHHSVTWLDMHATQRDPFVQPKDDQNPGGEQIQNIADLEAC